MSFPKAKTKRFNEVASCAPPVGSYNPKGLSKVQGVVIEKGNRFRETKESTDSLYTPLSVSDMCLNRSSSSSSCGGVTPKKGLFSSTPYKLDKEPAGKAMKKPPQGEVTKQKVLLETQIKKLLSERIDLDKKLSSKEEELRRLENKLQMALRDKTTAEGKVVTLERELNQKVKATEILKNKVSLAENSVERTRQLQQEVTSLRSEVGRREREQRELRQEVLSTRAALQSQLQASNDNLQQIQHAKAELETCNRILREEIVCLKKEITQTRELQAELSAEKDSLLQRLELANQRQQHLEAEVSRVSSECQDKLVAKKRELEEREAEIEEKMNVALESVRKNYVNSQESVGDLQKYKDSLEEELGDLRERIRGSKVNEAEKDDFIRHLKGELFAARDEMLQEKDELVRSQLEVDNLHSRIKALQETEQMLSDNLLNMTTKYQILEANLAGMEKQSAETCDRLTQELEVTKVTCVKVRSEVTRLEVNNARLMADSERDKARIDHGEQVTQKLQQEVTRQKQELETANSELCAANEELGKTLEETSEKYRQSLEEKEEIQTQNEALARECSLHRNTNLTLQQDNKSLIEQCEQCKEANEQLEKQNGSLHEQCKEAKEQAEKLERQHKAVSAECESHKDAVTRIQAQLKEAKDNSLECERRVVVAEVQQTQLLQTLNGTQRLLQINTQQSEEVRARGKATQLENEGLELKLQEVVSSSQRVQEQLTERLEQLQVTITTLEQNKHSLAQKVEELEAKVVSLEVKVKSSEESRSECQEYLKESQEKLTLTTRDFEGEKSRSSDLAQVLTQLEVQVKEAVEQQRSSEEQMSAALEERGLVLEQLAEVTQSSVESEQALTAKDGVINSLQVELSEVTDKIGQYEEQTLNLTELLSMQEQKVMEQSELLSKQEQKVMDQSEQLSKQEQKVMEQSEQLSKQEQKVMEQSELLSKQEQKVMEQSELMEQVQDEKRGLEMQLQRRLEQCDGLCAELESQTKEIGALKDTSGQLQATLNETENLLQKVQKELTLSKSSWLSQIAEYEGHLEREHLTTQRLEQQVSELRAETQTHKTQAEESQKSEERKEIERLTEEREQMTKAHRVEVHQLQEEMQSTISSFTEQIQQDQQKLDQLQAERSCDSLTQDELNKWKFLYEALYEKVRPFEDQLEAFQLEKDALLGRSASAQSEVEKLSRDYAKLLGHQNQKQKIRHVLKLKEENVALQKEVAGLKETVSKQTRQIRKFEDRRTDGAKRLSSKPFSHGKENLATPPMSPLQQANRS